MGELARRLGDIEVAEPGQRWPEQLIAALAVTGKDFQAVVLRTDHARAYIYAGEWVADCPRAGCKNVEFLTAKPNHLRGVAGTYGPPKAAFVCSNCRYVTQSIEWPADADQIMAVLDRRPIPQTRGWYPEGHNVAVRYGIPDGQTVAELLAENHEHGVI